MHAEAWGWLQRYVTLEPLTILDIGGKDVNSSMQGYSLKHLFPNSTITVLDKQPGPNVDIVADALKWTPRSYFDRVLCLEVFEHEERWRDLLGKIVAFTRPYAGGGDFIITCAAPGRAPHSGIENGPLAEGEWYKNIEREELESQLRRWGVESTVWENRRGWSRDLYAYGKLRA